jgi:D-psicose/D-tagatose/L-ribulose 3-epimerase
LNLLVHTASFSPQDVGLIDAAAALGFDGVELLFGDLDGLDAKATRQALQRTGLGLTACCVMTEAANPCSADAGVRQAAVDRLRRMADLTAEMGGEVMAGPLYAPVRHLTGRACTRDEWQRCRDVLAAGAAHAQRTGILMAIEPLNRFETYVVNTVADAVRLCQDVGSPALKVHVDTFHANIEEKDTAAAIRAAGPYLGHFHASENDRGVPGTGQVPWDRVFGALRDVDYSGWVTIESFATGIVDLCAAACIWRPIYDSAEGLARDGLAFLKATARRQAGA